VLLAAALATVPPAVLGWLLVDVDADTVELLSREVQLAAVDDVARTIDQEFASAQDALNAVGRVLVDEGMTDEEKIALALTQVEASEALDHAAVYGADGRLIDVIREDEAPRLELPEQLSWTLRAQAKDRNVTTGPASLHDGWPRVLVAVPLRAGGQVTGFAATLLSLEAVQRRVEHVAVARFQGDPRSLYVVDQELRIVADAGGDRARRLESARGAAILEGVRDQVLAGSLARSAEYVDRGVPVLGSVTGLRSRPWAVVAQVPTSRAYASLSRMRQIVIGAVAAAIALALLAGVLTARRITAPVGRLTAYARALARREFDAEVDVRTRDELAVLASTMRQAARDLAASEKRLAEEAAIRADLGRFMPAEVVDQIVRREREVTLGGERRQITVLFADVVAFTPFTEKRQPEEVVALLNELFTILTAIVFRHGGTVDKFIGDCVMAIWGAPTAQDDHAARALAAAEDMFRWLETGNAAWQERFDVTIRLAVGIHTGEAVVGNIGSETRMEYTAIGDVVNVAARLETIARPQQILLTQATRDAAGESSGFELIDAGEHRLAGKEAPLRLFELKIE
jgi:class 3 adenylate cyclase